MAKKMTSRWALCLCLVATTFVLVTSQARADFFSVSNFDSGWYNSLGQHSPANTNYFVRANDFRNFFAFDLSAIPTDHTIISATFRILNPANGANDGGSYLTFDVNPLAYGVILGGTAGVGAFNDFGTGDFYGGVGSPGPLGFSVLLGIGLSAAARSDIQASLGGTFLLGGRMSGPTGAFMFGASTFSTLNRLDIVTQAPEPIPLPSTLVMAGFGLLGFGRYGWRRLRA